MAKKIKIQIYDTVTNQKAWADADGTIVNGALVWDAGCAMTAPDGRIWQFSVDNDGNLLPLTEIT